jgi:hypothetical protein
MVKEAIKDTKYDSYGNLIGKILDPIEKGDLVEYIDSKSSFEKGRRIRIKIYLRGFWDGEKVCFDDDEKTVVRTKHWLTLKVKNLRNVIKIKENMKF